MLLNNKWCSHIWFLDCQLSETSSRRGVLIGNECLSRNFGDGILRLRHSVWNAISPRARSLQSCSRVRGCTSEPSRVGPEPCRTLFFFWHIIWRIIFLFLCILFLLKVSVSNVLSWLILNNTTMSTKEGKPEENKSSWKDFIYNPRTGEFMGRTASSWGKKPVRFTVYGT